MAGNHHIMKMIGPALVRTAPDFMFKVNVPNSLSSLMNFRSSRKISTVSGPISGISISVFR
jgi:hypothetical protein